jgi:hypothetical protein
MSQKGLKIRVLDVKLTADMAALKHIPMIPILFSNLSM